MEREKCAYCNKESKLTLEHVIPRSLCELSPLYNIGLNIAAGQYVRGESTIRDVCNDCNSKFLSRLDEYGKKLVESNCMTRFFVDDQTVIFKYDYEFLLRYLLKISYNSARVSQVHLEWLPLFRNYILLGKNRPEAIKIHIFLELIKSYKIRAKDRGKLPKEIRNWEYIPPLYLRVGRVLTMAHKFPNIVVRYVCINAYYFYLVLYHTETETIAKSEIKRIRKIFPDAIKLHSYKRSVKVRVSKRNVMDGMKDTLMVTSKLPVEAMHRKRK